MDVWTFETLESPVSRVVIFKLGELKGSMMFKLGDTTVVCTIYKNKICATIVCEECTNIENVKEFEKPCQSK